MVGRPFIAALAVVAAVAPVSVLGAFTSQGRPAPPTSTLDASSYAAAQRPAVALNWVIRAEDVVACATAAAELRRVRHDYRDQVRIVVYGVASDTTLLRDFLKSEFLGGTDLHALTEREFQERFAREPSHTIATPLLVLTDGNGQNQLFNADVRLAAGRRDVSVLSYALAAAVRTNAVLASNP